jgi:hypothetical protein
MTTRIIIVAALSVASAVAQSDIQAPPDQEQPDEQQYQGPSILSRDKSMVAERGGKLLDFRYYGQVDGVYDSGLVPVSVDPTGAVPNFGSFGEEIGFGVIGSRARRKDKISLEYHGSYRNYSKVPYFNGTDQYLDLAYSRYLSRHLLLDLKEIAGTTTLANGYFTYAPLTNTDLVAAPTNELFDNPTRYLQSRVDLTWIKSARLSFGFGGEGFLVRRRSLALAGLNGYQTHANAAYRLTRRQTLSANYSYSKYDYTTFFGNSNVQSVSLGYSLGLTRKWDFASQLGGFAVHTAGVETVNLDPAIAAIVGVTQANVTFSRTNYGPAADARLIRRFNHSSVHFGYSLGVVPGNGIYLTSRQSVGTAGFSYVSARRLTAALDFSYGTLSSIGQTLGQYSNVQSGGGLTYRLMRDTHLTARYDYRHYTTQNTLYQKDSNRVTLGIAYSPGDRPLAIW